MPFIRACPEANFDAATQTCSAEVWMLHEGILPPLTVAQGFEISGAILLLWAIAYTLRMVRNTVALR